MKARRKAQEENANPGELKRAARSSEQTVVKQSGGLKQKRKSKSARFWANFGEFWAQVLLHL